MGFGKTTELDSIMNMKDYQTVVSNFKTGNTDCKMISSVSPHDTIILGSPRIKITATRIDNDKGIKSLKLEKYKLTKDGRFIHPEEAEHITLSINDVNFISSFLAFLQSENIGELKAGNFKNTISLGDLNNLDIESLKKIMNTGTINEDFIKTIVEEGVTSRDVVSLGYRKSQLAIFDQLLNNPEYINTYKENNGLTQGTQEEKVFQYFFNINPWIFGYGLDYKYLSILQREATVGGPTVGGTNQELLDFVTGCRDYTILVELKKPSTNIFIKSQNRSGSRSLSSEFIHSISQILEYKASAQLFLENPSNRYDSSGRQFNQNTIDPKSILIIGRRNMMEGDNDIETKIKKRSFEIYKRDSRNIEILTYDDLLERANFIVGNSQT